MRRCPDQQGNHFFQPLVNKVMPLRCYIEGQIAAKGDFGIGVNTVDFRNRQNGQGTRACNRNCRRLPGFRRNIRPESSIKVSGMFITPDGPELRRSPFLYQLYIRLNPSAYSLQFNRFFSTQYRIGRLAYKPGKLCNIYIKS